MNLNKQGLARVRAGFILISLTLCCVCCCSPVSYRDAHNVIEVTTTPKTYVDRFSIKQEHKTIPIPPINDSFGDNSDGMSFGGKPREFGDGRSSNVKSVMPGEKTLRQSDGEDDDDDDGGEYEGFDYSRDDKSDRKKLQEYSSRPDALAAAVGGMPMMFIRELDMVAVQIPVKDSQKPQAKEWSEWSPCSRPCHAGKGLQSRWRIRTGAQDREQQIRPCYLADCGSRDFQFRPYFHPVEEEISD